MKSSHAYTHNPSSSSPLHRSPQARAASARVPPHEDVRSSPGSRLMRNGGHPSYSSPYEEDGKRRRMDDRYQPALPPPPPGAATAASMGEYDYAIEEHDDGRYIRAPRTSNGRYSPSAEGSAPPLPHPSSSEQRRTSLMDGEYDTGVPLARRRGDAAQAKASRLHIDTGSTAVGDAPPSRQSSSYQPSPGRTATVAKSAPPQKMTFSDRGGDAPPFDPRGEPPPPPRYHRSPAQSSYARQGGGPPHSHYVDERAGYESPPLRGPAPAGAHVQSHPSPLPHQQSHPTHLHQQAPHVQGSVASLPHSARPQAHQGALPSARAFAPQTATLPSPAYHTTHFMRSGGHPGAPPNHSSSTAPRTAGLNPPPTARLPDHLRSPPSSKTQFLSLFANFYDSLSDSRTLKATLEDQVRRSNTLLQTLQRSSRVLELSVDRRLKEERDVWEARVHDLEARCRELERQLGVARPDEDETESRRTRNGTDARRESGKNDADEEEDRGSKVVPPGSGSDREHSRGRSISQEEEDEVLSEKELQEAPKRGRGRADPRRGADRLSRKNDDDDDEDDHDADLRRERTRMRPRGDKEESEQPRSRKSQTQSGSPAEEEDEVVDDAMQD